MDLSRLTTVAGLARLKSADGVPLFAESTVRGWMERDLQGFRTACIIKMGGRTMVDLDALEAWLETQRGGRQERKVAPTSSPASAPPPTADLDAALASIGLVTTAGRARRRGVPERDANTA